jgi:hypothetical protein
MLRITRFRGAKTTTSSFTNLMTNRHENFHTIEITASICSHARTRTMVRAALALYRGPKGGCSLELMLGEGLGAATNPGRVAQYGVRNSEFGVRYSTEFGFLIGEFGGRIRSRIRYKI